MYENRNPAKENITYYRGDGQNFEYTIENTNLTGATLLCQVRESADSPKKLLELTLDNGGIVITDLVSDDVTP
ncbi:hypothetical protein [Phenylobacterium sp. SCN 70-31]|uniref:hypothetical protein n=1 Tax=Phenylobacterium sp. SCN 70-31 TaxID=1660129 RepID=UPI0025EA8005|nr:hypothetical protein [Phenylobacterium sp. SCN 70-31]